MKNSLLLIVFCLSIFTINSQLANDEVVFPDWEKDYEKIFKSYSGFLPIDDGNMHYVFLESQTKPSNGVNIPVVLWLQGGPGCSSLVGMAAEFGPFLIKQGAPGFSDIPNQYAWNKQAHLLFLETPLGVGFSNTTSGGPGNWSDENTAKQNYQALLKFFSLNPAYQAMDFHMAGESYAGMYVPILAKTILDAQTKMTPQDPKYINLKGILIGNGLMNANETGSQRLHLTQQEFMFYHNFFGPNLGYLSHSCTPNNTSPACQFFYRQASQLINQTNPYSIYGTCYGFTYNSLEQQDFYQFKGGLFDRGSPCLNLSALNNYFTRDDVKKALKIDAALPPWSTCNPQIQLDNTYTPYPDGSISILPWLATQKINILIYNGETDAVIPFLINDFYVEVVKDTNNGTYTVPYQIWNTPDTKQVGGWWTQLNKNLNYVKVRGAGHMVPIDQPEAAFYLFNQTVNNQPLA